MKERTKFVLKWEERFNEAEGGRGATSTSLRSVVCLEISRQTGYEWIGRYRETWKMDALVERSRRPLSSPSKGSEQIEASVVAARKHRSTYERASCGVASGRVEAHKSGSAEDRREVDPVELVDRTPARPPKGAKARGSRLEPSGRAPEPADEWFVARFDARAQFLAVAVRAVDSFRFVVCRRPECGQVYVLGCT